MPVMIIGKAITRLLKPDIIYAAGTLRTCPGIESGIEAAKHSVPKSFQYETSECC